MRIAPWYEHPAFSGGPYPLSRYNGRWLDRRFFEPIVEDMLVLVSSLKELNELRAPHTFELDPAKRPVLKRIVLPYFVGHLLTDADKAELKKKIAATLVHMTFSEGYFAMPIDVDDTYSGMACRMLQGWRHGAVDLGTAAHAMQRFYRLHQMERDDCEMAGCNWLDWSSHSGPYLNGVNAWVMGVHQPYALRVDWMQMQLGFNPRLHAVT